MAAIPAGTFVAGTDSAELPALLERYNTRHADLFVGEIPKHSVRVAAFAIDRTEVTKAQFRDFLLAVPAWRKDAQPEGSSNGHYLEDWTGTDFAAGEGARPVVFVTWPAARAFCAWEHKRLPTEAEWEFAARGGRPDPEFPWGSEPPDATRANWSGAGLGRTSDVGRYPANGYGLFDMAGNVWEYVADPWPVDTTRLSTAARAEGSGMRYVIRGGSFEGAAVNLRVRYRDSHPAGGAGPHVGFRCAR
jgi:formylglycine-generating enzyme required for sulfatase activity